ncbi:MAG: alpha-amylase family glycosyl hydrolase [Chloroflexota bacterium]
MTNKYHWWQKGIIYQIYPRSFQDSNGDGIGDLRGITQRLDYLKSLNIEIVWLSPIYPSPMHDFGYDVSDYTAIHPMFGTMTDFDHLLAETHHRGMKLILDLVPNHTSDEHNWFIESRSSRDNPKRDWYIWRDPAPDGGPPNNWLSFFGGPAWTFDEATGQYYLHQFVSQQPELNYRHPDVLPTMLDTMRFWLDKGVDGFRIDVLWLMIKDELFRDNPENLDWDGKIPFNKLTPLYTANLPEVHDVIRQMRQLLDEYDERMMVGEMYLPLSDLMDYYGSKQDECHLPFNFHLILATWNAKTIQALVEDYEASLPEDAWPNWVLGNHDQHRVASRVGANQARVANMLLLTLRGTPTTYYGEELGLENVPIPLDLIQDPPAVNQPEVADIVGRDPERTPMPWDSSSNAGFTTEDVVPWLPLNENFAEQNVAQQQEDTASMLNFYRGLTALRQSEPALSVGDYASVEGVYEKVYAYRRTAPDADQFLIILNFATERYQLDLSQIASTATIAIATDMVRAGSVDLKNLILQANEGLVLRLP